MFGQVERSLVSRTDMTSLSYYTLTKIAEATGYADPIAAIPAVHERTGKRGVVTLDSHRNFVSFRWEEPASRYPYYVIVDGELPHGPVRTIDASARVAAELARNLKRGGIIVEVPLDGDPMVDGNIVGRFDAPKGPFKSVALTTVGA